MKEINEIVSKEALKKFESSLYNYYNGNAKTLRGYRLSLKKLINEAYENGKSGN